MNKIASHLRGDEKLEPDKLADHTKCRFGKWYYGEGMKMCGHLPSFRTIEEPHCKIHSIHLAQRLFNELESLSHEIINLLDEIKRDYEGKNLSLR